MNAYIQEAARTYCDMSQTYVARQLAYTTLTNAGFTKDDLENLLQSGPDQICVMVFCA
jgi:hypothetical protein